MIGMSFRKPLGIMYPASRIFGWITDIRNRMYDRGWITARAVDIPVICVGNLAVGGTGKTPMVMHVIRMLHTHGIQPMVISRGYGGRAGKTPETVPVNGRFERYGDEPLLIARTFPEVPVIVSIDRYRGIIWGIRHYEIDCVILDDGFQHRRLKRNLDIVMLDSRRPFTSDRVLPMGRLREYPENLDRSHIAVFTHTDESPASERDLEFLRTLRSAPMIVNSRHEPSGFRRANTTKCVDAAEIDQPICMVSAIGSPAGFHHSVSRAGLIAGGAVVYPDHCSMKPSQWIRSVRRAVSMGCRSLVITAKDETRLPDDLPLSLDVFVLDITIELDNHTDVEHRIVQCIRVDGGSSGG